MNKKTKKSPVQKAARALPDTGEKNERQSNTVSASELADWLGLSLAHIAKLAAAKRVVRTAHNKYLLKESVQAYCEYKNATPSDDPKSAKARTDAARAELTEIELARVRGELAPIKHFEIVWCDMALKARTKMQNIPSRAAPLLANKSHTAPQLKSILQKLTDEILREIADYNPADIVGDLLPSNRDQLDTADAPDCQ